nr:CMRF35-like molecule 3 [Danio rerio]|eukprot:XP_021333856.1 CMRF35-like molecule 3 [Danio rerio]
MKFALRVCVFLLMARASVCADITVTAAEGGEAVINCPYGGGYETSYKYFYIGPYKDSTLWLQSYGGESPVFNGRFTLKDDHKARLFIVTIRDLQMNDAGEYNCAAGWRDSRSIQLNVIRGV